MKLFAVCLLLVAAVTVTAQKKKKESAWEMMGKHMETMKEKMDAGIDEMLDDSTDSGLQSDAQEFLFQLKEVCEEESVYTSQSESSIPVT